MTPLVIGAAVAPDPAITQEDERPVASRVLWLTLGLATALAAALRLPFLAHQSLWFDEIFTRTIVGRHSLGGLWDQVRATESTPPLYYVLAKISAGVAGTRSAAAMRAPSALALTAAVPVAYLAFRRLLGQRGALAAAVFVAVNPMLVSYSTDARSYGLLVLTALLSVWALSAVLQTGSGRAHVAWVVACLACVWTHYFGAFTVAGEVLVLLAMRPSQWRRTLAWVCVMVAGALPLIPLVIHQNDSQDAAFIAGLSVPSRLEQTLRQFAMGANVPRTWLEAAGLAVLGLTVLAGAALSLRHRGGRIVLSLALITVGVPLVLGLTGIEDRFYVRNVIVAVPLLGAVAAPAFVRLRYAPLGLYLLLAVLTSIWVATNWRYEQTDWRAAIAHAGAIDTGVPVITSGFDSTRVAGTYLQRTPTSATIRSSRAVLIVQPSRGPGDRALVPAPIPPALVTALGGFTQSRTLLVQGFRVIVLQAPRPVAIVPGSLGGAAVFPSSSASSAR